MRGRRCVDRVTLLARLRLTPGELDEALEVLEREGVVAVGVSEVCYTGALEALEDRAYMEIVEEVRGLTRLRSIVAYVKDARGVLPHIDVIVSRRDGVGFAARVLTGRLPPERLVAEAKHVARTVARLAEEPNMWEECCMGLKPPNTLVPVIVIRRGAPRVVEGVPVRPLDMFLSLVRDPSPLLADPVVRVYRVAYVSS